MDNKIICPQHVKPFALRYAQTFVQRIINASVWFRNDLKPRGFRLQLMQQFCGSIC